LRDVGVVGCVDDGYGIVGGRNRLATASLDKTVLLWDIDKTQPLRVFKPAGGAVAISPDGERLVSGQGSATLGVWNVQTG
jgi:WD40 repeat protein